MNLNDIMTRLISDNEIKTVLYKNKLDLYLSTISLKVHNFEPFS